MKKLELRLPMYRITGLSEVMTIAGVLGGCETKKKFLFLIRDPIRIRLHIFVDFLLFLNCIRMEYTEER